MNHRLTQPSANELIGFYFCTKDREAHAVYKWLRARRPYLDAERKFLESEHIKSLRPGVQHPQFGEIHPGLQRCEMLDFARTVSYCIGRYRAESGQKVWTDSTSRERKAAANAYHLALGWSRGGFGPYAEDDHRRLDELLQTTRGYMLGKHVSGANRLKGGTDRPIGMLIRDLAGILGNRFDLRGRALTSIVRDLLRLVDQTPNAVTVRRHISHIERDTS